MRNKDIFRQFDEATARTGAIIYLATEAYDSCSDQLRTFLEDHSNEEIIRAFDGALPELALDDFGDEEIEPAEFFGILSERRIDGFLVRFETPVRNWHSPTSFGYSWGHYKTQWIYRPTLVAVLEAGITWAIQAAESDRKKSA